jgi:hypothetical protein
VVALGNALGVELRGCPRLPQGLGEVEADGTATMLCEMAGDAPGFAKDGG